MKVISILIVLELWGFTKKNDYNRIKLNTISIDQKISITQNKKTYQNYNLVKTHSEFRQHNYLKKYVNDTIGRLKKIIRILHKPSNHYVLVTAHRGDWRNAPENSIQAIKNCINMGVDIVEIDVRQTKDGQLVLMHDKAIDRTTTGKGKVSECTLKDLKKLYLRNGMGHPTYRRVPTLEEALLIAKGKIVLNIDIKGDIPFRRIASVLTNTKTSSQTIVRSYRNYKEARNYYGSSLDSIIYIPGISNKLDFKNYFYNWEKSPVNPIYYAPKFKTDREPLVSFLNTISNAKNGIWVHSISLGVNRTGGHDDELALTSPDKAWGWLIEKGIGIIQTDRPLMLLNYLRKHNLHK